MDVSFPLTACSLPVDGLIFFSVFRCTYKQERRLDVCPNLRKVSYCGIVALDRLTSMLSFLT